MKAITMAAMLAAASSGAFATHAGIARAGDVGNATLACFGDTTEFDQLMSDDCASGWRPGQPNPTTAYFEVVGLAPGSYAFAWSRTGCGNAPSCTASIRKDTSGGQPVTVTVTIQDTQTGAVKVVSATAEYVDIWN